MPSRLASLLVLAILLASGASAKDKSKNKSAVPEDILRARTALVVIDPEAGEPLDRPYSNAMARENVEKALMDWGRFELIPDGQNSDLIIVVRTGNKKGIQPTIKGGPIDHRPGVGEVGDATIRIGGGRGQTPPLNDPGASAPPSGPHLSDVADWSEDAFTVYRGGVGYPLDAPAVWRYVAKDCLRPPKVAAVEQFRKALADAEKPQVPKKP